MNKKHEFTNQDLKLTLAFHTCSEGVHSANREQTRSVLANMRIPIDQKERNTLKKSIIFDRRMKQEGVTDYNCRFLFNTSQISKKQFLKSQRKINEARLSRQMDTLKTKGVESQFSFKNDNSTRNQRSTITQLRPPVLKLEPLILNDDIESVAFTKGEHNFSTQRFSQSQYGMTRSIDDSQS